MVCSLQSTGAILSLVKCTYIHAYVTAKCRLSVCNAQNNGRSACGCPTSFISFHCLPTVFSSPRPSLSPFSSSLRPSLHFLPPHPTLPPSTPSSTPSTPSSLLPFSLLAPTSLLSLLLLQLVHMSEATQIPPGYNDTLTLLVDGRVSVHA